MHYNDRAMNAIELLTYLTENQVSSLFRAARSLPADKLDWKPAPGARSALDQVQEAATAIDAFWDVYATGKVEWDSEKHAAWNAEKEKFTDLDALEAECKRTTQRLVDHMNTVKAGDLMNSVSLPFPGDHRVADILAYHYWNLAYHEGQIYYIGSLLAAE